MTDLTATLRSIVGDSAVLTDPDVVAGYVTDWTGRYRASSGIVVRPGSTSEVAAVIAACAGTGTCVVPQGGNTGLVGGSVPHRGEIVLNLARLGEVMMDVESAQVTAGAGVTIASLRQAATGAELAYGVDLASRDSATVGGTIGTNAGGLRVLRHGDTRRQVIGIEAVLGDGTVVSHLDGLTRDNTGYHLPSLLTGSEGTLAVVTAARLRLVPPAGPSAVAILGFDTAADAVRGASWFKSRLAGVSAVELFLPAGLALVMRVCGLASPLAGDFGAYLLVECDGPDPLDALTDCAAAIPGVLDAAVASDAAGRASLWAYRERHTESIASVGTAIKLDVTLPTSSAATFVDTVPGTVSEISTAARVWMFGHIADGNVHVNITDGVDVAQLLEDRVLRLVASLGGSISSEHGIGVAKKAWLPLNRSAAEISMFRRIKSALDPAGILNPNVLLP